MPRLFLATRNSHKVGELKELLGNGWAVGSIFEAGRELPEIEETGRTFLENATLKAVGLSLHVPGWVLADDSGLEVEALGGAPGVISAHYAGRHGDDAANNQKVLAEMEAVGAKGPAQRRAQFRCVLAVAEEGRRLASFEGVVEGRLLDRIEGTRGFGYDGMFVPEGYEESFGLLPAEVKARISHRSQALRQFLNWANQTPDR
jgi:XTP/dITP diphosphohydrolase